MSVYLDDPFANLLSERPSEEEIIAARRAAIKPLAIVSAGELNNLPKVTYLVEDLLPEASLTVALGPSGIGKSFVALDLALCVAAGIPWHGREVRSGRVLYLAGEGLRGLRGRIDAWLKANPHADAEAVDKNLLISRSAVHLLDSTETARLTATIAGIDDLVLLCVDTWARALAGGDENSAKDTGTAIAVLDSLRDEFGLTTLVVHHTGKDGTTERGSTALRGAADSMVRVWRDVSGHVALSCDKSKDSAPFKSVSFSLLPFGESCALVHAGTPGLPAKVGAGYKSAEREEKWF